MNVKYEFLLIIVTGGCIFKLCTLV